MSRAVFSLAPTLTLPNPPSPSVSHLLFLLLTNKNVKTANVTTDARNKPAMIFWRRWDGRCAAEGRGVIISVLEIASSNQIRVWLCSQRG